MSFPAWMLVLGVLLLGMVLVGALLGRMQLTSAILYLGVGWGLGPQVLDILRPDPFEHVGLLMRLAELGLMISLFAVGLRLGVPLLDRRWRLPLRLAFLSLAAMVGLTALVGVTLLDLPLGAAVLLGAILAPTDPVLASGVHTDAGEDPERIGFSLAAEGGLNDGAALPFVLLGLALLASGSTTGVDWLHWTAVDLLWTPVTGAVLGAALGAAVGWCVVFLRSRYQQAVGFDAFLGLGLIGVAYGAALSIDASGFLAVLAAGIAFGRVSEQPAPREAPLGRPEDVAGHPHESLETHSHHASATMKDSVGRFNDQVEEVAEMGLVLMVGAMLPYAPLSPSVLGMALLGLLVLRPASALVATVGERLTRREHLMLGWFGIRGVGSVYYLLFVLDHGLPGVPDEVGTTLVSVTLWTVALSILLHGLTTRTLTDWHDGRR
ncbi:cation:proton antiporter [Roseateles noduli]|uniref:cation:proton antiporter n=1 Tax=Roseateles noduli TaxID=2052484 RepID=UPI003D64909F